MRGPRGIFGPAASQPVDIGQHIRRIFTYDHRLKRIGHPVRSAIHKLEIGGLVVGWVTTSEYPLLYVFFASFFFVACVDSTVDSCHDRGNRYIAESRPLMA
jgi:4-hydroxybenzoate polyprenyltransferase